MATGLTRIYLLGVPIDVVPEESLAEVLEGFYTLEDHRQIILLDFHEFMKSRRSRERRRVLKQSALVIPTSRMITGAAGFLNKKVPPLRRNYLFIIHLLGILERKGKSVYLLGCAMRDVRSAEATLRTTFPGLRVVGRYSGHFPQDREDDIITAIKKASPTLLLAGKGLKGRYRWISRNRHRFSPGLSVWECRSLDVFSGRKPKPNDRRGARLSRGFFGALAMPWRMLRLLRYLLFFLLLLIARIRGD